MSRATGGLLKSLRTYALSAVAVFTIASALIAGSQAANSTDTATQPDPAAKPTPGNSPFTFVQPGTSPNGGPVKRDDNGKNEK